MKCLLCNLSFSNQDELFEHYVQFHKIDKSNWFFKNLFNTKNFKRLKKCLRCEEFIYDSKSKAEHDFLNHFSEGKEQPFENKPLNIRVLENKITIYSIEYSKHKDSYDFFDSEKCVNDFLLNCRNKLKKKQTKIKHLSVHLLFKINKNQQLQVHHHHLILYIGQHLFMTVFFLTISYFLVLKVIF